MGKFAKILLIGVLVVLSGLSIYFIVCNMTYSEGSRAGYLIKVSKKGVMFKTYEGQLNLGGIGQGEVNAIVANNIWDFSVPDDSIFNVLTSLQGNHVRLHYKEKFKAFPWQGETNYFIYQAEKVE